MSRSDEHLPFDVEGIADRLRAERPRPSDETLDAARMRVMGRMKPDRGAAMSVRTKTVALLTGGLLLTTGAATAAVTQTNNQSSTTNQAITQTSGGGVVIGGGAQNAQNNSNTTLNNCQIVGFAASASCATYAPPRPCGCNGLTFGTQQAKAITARKTKAAPKPSRSRRAITRIFTVGG